MTGGERVLSACCIVPGGKRAAQAVVYCCKGVAAGGVWVWRTCRGWFRAADKAGDAAKAADKAGDAARRAPGGVTIPEIPKFELDPSFYPPGVTSNTQFGRGIMQWGTGAEGAKAAINNLTRDQLINGGVTREIAQKWLEFYRNEFARNKNNLTAKYRAELMERALELLK